MQPGYAEVDIASRGGYRLGRGGGVVCRAVTQERIVTCVDHVVELDEHIFASRARLRFVRGIVKRHIPWICCTSEVTASIVDRRVAVPPGVLQHRRQAIMVRIAY